MRETFGGRLYDRLSALRGALGEDYESVCRSALLSSIDTHWVNHLIDMDYLKTGIGLRGMAQRDPLVEYKSEAYRAFEGLTESIYNDWLIRLLRLPLDAELSQAQDDSPYGGGNLTYSGGSEGDITRDSSS